MQIEKLMPLIYKLIQKSLRLISMKLISKYLPSLVSSILNYQFLIAFNNVIIKGDPPIWYLRKGKSDYEANILFLTDM